MESGMGIRRLVVAFAAVLLCAVGVPNASALTLQFPPILNEQDRTIPISGTVTSVIARADMGNIVVGSGSSPVIRIHETWNYSRPTVTQSLRSGVLTVTADCPVDRISFNKCSADLTIVVPAEVTVDAYSNFGDVTTKGLKGNEKLATDFGDVRALNVSAWSIAAVTSYGNVDLDLVSAPTKAAGTSSFGDISMKVPAGTYAVSTKTNWGDVSVKGITKDDDATRQLTARSSYGDIAIARR